MKGSVLHSPVLPGLACAMLVAVTAPGARAEAPLEPIAVYCRASSDNGFVNPEIGDSTADLIKILATKKKTLRLVDSATAADVMVTVTGRAVVDTGARDYRTRTSGSGNRRHTTTSTSKKLAKVVDATLSVGHHQVKLRGVSSGFWSSAAGELADHVDDWVKQNRQPILEARSAASTPKPASTSGARASEPSAGAPGAWTPATVAGAWRLDSAKSKAMSDGNTAGLMNRVVIHAGGTFEALYDTRGTWKMDRGQLVVRYANVAEWWPVGQDGKYLKFPAPAERGRFCYLSR